MFDYPNEWWDLLLRMVAAAVCGAILGIDREWREKPAGLRTNMIVAIGACAFTVVALRVYESISGTNHNTDPLRVVEGVVGGIGFLGAGAIIRARGEAHVEGLTTAASVWMVGALGVACGLAYYDIAAVTTVMGIIVLTLIGWLTPPHD